MTVDPMTAAFLKNKIFRLIYNFLRSPKDTKDENR